MDLQYWVTLVPLLAAAGAAVAWVANQLWKGREERKKATDSDRMLLSGEFERLRQELKELHPTLAQLRRDYAEAVTREIELLDKLRELSLQNVEAASERKALKRAIRVLNEEVGSLRTRLSDAGIPLPPPPDISFIDRLDDADGTLRDPPPPTRDEDNPP